MHVIMKEYKSNEHIATGPPPPTISGRTEFYGILTFLVIHYETHVFFHMRHTQTHIHIVACKDAAE